MKLGKIFLSLIGVLILVVGGVAWYVLSNINAIVKDVVETKGSEVLQTPVGLKLVDIKLLDGSAKLGLFTIDNYKGFNQPHILSFDEITVDIDPKSVNQSVIVLDEVTVSGVSVVAEQVGTTTNLQTLLDKLPKSDTAAAQTEDTSSQTQEVLLAIKKLNFIDNSLSLATENYGKHDLNLPNIARANLGSESSGLTPEQLAKAIVKPLIEEAQDKLEKSLVDLAKKELEDRYGEQIDKEKEKLKSKLEDELGVDSEEVDSKLKDLKKLF